MRLELDVPYEVLPKEDLHLTITFGHGQLGASVVKLEDNELARGEIKDFIISSEHNLNGKRIRIWSIVADVSNKTNQTSVTYRLEGGKINEDYTLRGEVDEEGGIMTYRATFELYIEGT